MTIRLMSNLTNDLWWSPILVPRYERSTILPHIILRDHRFIYKRFEQLPILYQIKRSLRQNKPIDSKQSIQFEQNITLVFFGHDPKLNVQHSHSERRRAPRRRSEINSVMYKIIPSLIGSYILNQEELVTIQELYQWRCTVLINSLRIRAFKSITRPFRESKSLSPSWSQHSSSNFIHNCKKMSKSNCHTIVKFST